MAAHHENKTRIKIIELKKFIRGKRKDIRELAAFYAGKKIVDPDASEKAKSYKRTREDDARFLPTVINLVCQIEEARNYLDQLLVWDEYND